MLRVSQETILFLIKSFICIKENIKEVEIKTELNKKDQEKKKMLSKYMKVKKKVYEVKKLTTENKDLYGSIKPTEISKIINQSDKIDQAITNTTFK